jgi:hypothetical protein
VRWWWWLKEPRIAVLSLRCGFYFEYMPMPRMAEDDGGSEMRVSLSLSFSLPLARTTTTTTTGLLRPVWNGWLCLRTSWRGRIHVAVVARALILQVVVVA